MIKVKWLDEWGLRIVGLLFCVWQRETFILAKLTGQVETDRKYGRSWRVGTARKK
jgi:hypothetical protein